ncbi:helix-turn-helix domain-containing protein [Pseudothauera nasutitermitis]|nr:helix-turn-helix transcriptional regulator [Pseudothauera nasutitermitis]
MSLADRIRQARNALRMKQGEVASIAGIPLSTYRKYEGGTTEPGAAAIAGLLRTGMSANWLLTGEGPMLMGRPDGPHDDPAPAAQDRPGAAWDEATADALPFNGAAMRRIIAGVLEAQRDWRDLSADELAQRAVGLYAQAMTPQPRLPHGQDRKTRGNSKDRPV